MESKQNTKPEIINISNKPLNINFYIRGIKKLVFLPDYSPSKGRLPVGTVAVFNRDSHLAHSGYIGPDIGCGMLLAKFKDELGDDLSFITHRIASALVFARGELGTLGGGNHFINIYEVKESELPMIKEGDNLVLIHSGSRRMGVDIFQAREIGDSYLRAHDKAIDFARRNRSKLLEIVQEEVAKGVTILCDNIHNYIEKDGHNIIYRKGAMKLTGNDLGIIPSTMSGDAILVQPKSKLSELEWSINHGTGRKLSRSEARKIQFDSESIRKKVCIPHFISDDSLRTENPACYKSIAEIEPLIEPYVKIVGRLKPKAFVK